MIGLQLRLGEREVSEMITTANVNELIDATMQDCPLPSVADLLCCATKNNAEIMFTFIQKHYNEVAIELGLAEFRERIRFMNHIFGK